VSNASVANTIIMSRHKILSKCG